ncbi:MAG TPA: GNAT family N-acetyltransferase [Myxococcales bacterium]|nr:GNAT family N-acetyltransferase [Myxococcales bacterium]
MGAISLMNRRLGESYCERAILADGTQVVLRPIRQEDGPLLQAGLLELSERTRYFRFHSPRKELSPEELSFLTEVDGESHFALAALKLPAQKLVAVGRWVRSKSEQGQAEIALVVTDALQGRGLGQLLLSRLREAALERNVTRFTGSIIDENRAIRGLLRKLGARIGLAFRGVCEIELALT